MASYRLSAKAAADIDGIYEYTIGEFGLAQARAYVSGLHTLCELLALNPMTGRAADEITPGLRRMVYQSHVVFYIKQRGDVRIVRVLHQSMDLHRYL